MFVAWLWAMSTAAAVPVSTPAPTEPVDWAAVPAGTFASALRFADVPGDTTVDAFWIMRTPVTNAQFAHFVRQHPQWRRELAPRAYAEPTHYLAQLADAGAANGKPAQPVTGVSWFAAQAYCQAQGARLPTWNEWEYVSAADETRRDARADPAWRERILSWYAKPSNEPLADVGQSPANVYGVHDVHGLVWEWVEDVASLLVVEDKRDPGQRSELKFCGGGALNLRDPGNFVVSMRLALLSSLQPADSTANLGFRCARAIAPSRSSIASPETPEAWR